MAFPKQHHFIARHGERHSPQPPDVHELMQPEYTGSEAAYLKSLIDSRATVTVVLTDGEQLQGRIRYYDCDCFSIGLSATGPRIFLRKDSVAYISEDRQS
jgi:small nuclear ribonucleoprotein (snRNP)-like protein